MAYTLKKKCLITARYALFTIGLTLFPTYANAQVDAVQACNLSEPPNNCQSLWAQASSITVPQTGIRNRSPNPTCAGGIPAVNWAKLAADGLTALYDPRALAGLSTDLIDVFQKKVVPGITRVIRGDVGRMIDRNFGATTDQGNCSALMVAVPQKATVRGYRLEANGRRCVASQDCGYWKFLYPPQEAVDGGVRVWTTTFINWSHNLAIPTKMTIFYELPAGERPIEAMRLIPNN